MLYVDGEMPAVTIQERLKQIAKGFEEKKPDPSYLQIVAQDLQTNGIKDLSTLIGQQDIDTLLEDRDLVILDNLSSLVRSGNENEADS